MRSTERGLFFIVIRLFTLWTLVAPSWARAALLDPSEYQGIKEVSIEMIQKASPHDAVFVGVGRSPTPVITFLSSLYPNSTVNLPLTRSTDLEKAIVTNEKYPNPSGHLSARAKLDQHFERHLGPMIANLNGRKLVFVDYVVNGGFLSALRLLKDYLSRLHPDIKFDYVVLTTKISYIGKEDLIPEDKVIFLDSKSKELQRRLQISHYDSISEYGAWTLGYGPETPAAPKQSAHEIFKAEMFDQILSDSHLPPNLKSSPLCKKILP